MLKKSTYHDPDIACVMLDVFKRSGSHITNHKHESMTNMTNIQGFEFCIKFNSLNCVKVCFVDKQQKCVNK